mmetsp:Transcript_22237/g.32349  ORF Transcript_22237/g.32349 Transcript_22237/m.32349 type:complete len:445 (-) Transcript_22237:227-1561(-)
MKSYRYCTHTLIIFTLLIFSVFYLLITRLGIGSYHLNPSLQKYIQQTSIEIVTELSAPPGNIAVSKTGRIFFNFHPEYAPVIKVAELIDQNTYIPFPNASFQQRIVTCLSMRVDEFERLWLLDFANHGVFSAPSLYAISISEPSKDDLVYKFPKDVAGFGSMLNDFSVSRDGKFIYIADTSIVGTTPALIVFSVEDRSSYRFMSSHRALYGLSSYLQFDSHIVAFGPFGLRINVDSIALSRDGRALYFSPLTGTNLLCLPTAEIHNFISTVKTLPQPYDQESSIEYESAISQLNSSLEVVLQGKPFTDGITTDDWGNIWLTAVEDFSIAVARPTKDTCKHGADHHDQCPAESEEYPCKKHFKIDTVVRDKALMRWPDGFSFGPDGLYLTNSALHLKFRGISAEKGAPYHILKIPSHAIHGLIDVDDQQDDSLTFTHRLQALSGH